MRPKSRAEIIEHIRQAGFVPLPEETIRVGDTYMAERNTGLVLMTAKEIRTEPEGGVGSGFIIPVEHEYPYDMWECVKIKS